MSIAEQCDWEGDERPVSLVTVILSLLGMLAGLFSAAVGFVFDRTVMIVVGTLLLGSSSIMTSLAKRRTRR